MIVIGKTMKEDQKQSNDLFYSNYHFINLD